MFCAVSGTAPEKPVVSTKSGHVFEASVIEKYIETTGKCPVTGEALDVADLLPLKTTTTVKPRPVAATSIPGMLTLFQNEWDALMLETFTYKQQLETVRQELGHALYQHDAACRVIARLVKERDDARAALAEARPTAPPPAASAGGPAPATAPAAMDVEVAGLSADVIAAFETTAKALSKGRKKRQPAAGYPTAEQLSPYGVVGSLAAHTAGAVCLDAHANDPLVASGGADGAVVVSVSDGSNLTEHCKVTAHSQRVTAVKLHATRPLVISSSLDGTTRVSDTKGAEKLTLRAHSGAVTGCTLHSTGDYVVTCSEDRSWALFDLNSGRCLLKPTDDLATAYTATAFHPDGLILGTAMGAAVRVWDVKSQSLAHTFEGHTGAVTSLHFSENGYYLATGSADACVKLWDLRKLKNLSTITTDAAIGAVAFDFSGQYLAVGGTALELYDTKGWSAFAAWSEQSAAISGVAFGAGASFVASASADGVVKLYGAA